MFTRKLFPDFFKVNNVGRFFRVNTQ